MQRAQAAQPPPYTADTRNDLTVATESGPVISKGQNVKKRLAVQGEGTALRDRKVSPHNCDGACMTAHSSKLIKLQSSIGELDECKLQLNKEIKIVDEGK